MHFGAPSLYLTISPLDHKHILAFQICNRTVHLDLNNLPKELFDEDFRLKQASRNPAPLAQFFHVIVKTVLGSLFGGSKTDGIFGPLSAYYGMVEAQNRGTLHIHLLLWIKGAPHPDTLYDKLVTDTTFQTKLFTYLETIIKPDLTNYTQDFPSLPIAVSIPPVSMQPLLNLNSFQTPSQLASFLTKAIPEYQTHKHAASCFKNPRTKGKCRYRKPSPLNEQTHFNATTGEILLARHHPMINSFNPYLTCVVNSNTDISFLFNCRSSMAIIHYITMYITKSDDQVDNYYALMTAAKQSLIEKPLVSTVTTLTPPQSDARALLLRVYQKINQATQIPANIVTTLLLNLPMSYKSHEYVLDKKIVDLILKFTVNFFLQ
jgi:hypothetical protein